MSAPAAMPPRTGRPAPTVLPLVLLTLASCFWGGNIIAGKLAIGTLDPLVLSTLRWSAACVIILPFALPALRAEWAAMRGGIFWLAFYGIVGFTSFNALLYAATLYTSGINIAMIQAAVPVFVMLGNFILYKVRSTVLHLVAVALAIYGVVHVSTHGVPQRLLGLQLNLGDAMMVLACACYAFHSLFLRYKPRVGWKSFILVTSFFAALFSLALQSLFGGGPARLVAEMAAMPLGGWLIVLYTALLPSILSQLFYVRGVEAVGPNRASLFINLVPVFGALFSVVILGERLEPFHAVAAAFIIGGISLAEYAAQRRA